MTALGAVSLPQLPPERLRAVARAAEEAGLEELWLWEDCFWGSGIASAAAALAWTERLRVGVGVLPVPLRNLALTAMEVATLHRLFPDRVDIAVGHGVQEWMAQVGARVASPMTLLGEYLTALRALLRGERVSVHGRYVVLDAVALDWPPASPPAVLARTDSHRVVVYVLAATGPGGAERLEAERRRLGYEAIAGAGVAGDARAVADAAKRWADAGADAVVLQPTVDDPDPEGFVRFVAGEVGPLVR
jgi:alkanesulfonate monooxygenase SsuD/methylene tetrahydromethanopterin reductase-like flavin-dependent oxidoreductase (luciferase family)